ncbi:transcription factor ILR3-like isoform X1 [Musa acuminata AAA Group]|uniref:transcription factor ILR3-like isoform X1 n=1 Tax=Musa acuminata AAA Group TaxID=214697 RepID=UPI0031E3816D
MGTDPIEDFWIDGGGSDSELQYALDGFHDMVPTVGVGKEEPYRDLRGLEQNSSRKRARNEPRASKSKACREKIRRDRQNKRFIELSSILDPGRPPRADKASILGDATRVLMRLRAEAQELKESNKKLHETIKDMKVEKNELREEKMRLKADKDKLEQQIKVWSVPPVGFLPHPIAFHPAAAPAAFVPQVQASADKTTPFSGFPGMAMWQWLPPAVMDTTQDPKLWPPNA